MLGGDQEPALISSQAEKTGYIPPVLIHYGTLEDIVQGKSGLPTDFNAVIPGSQPT